ncbi:MAG: 50S ribosomal protein L22 [Alphaproteobacteria bacterium]|nr:50S ribosomal protein L22 [Alphaproteobacteria bacterium]
MTMVEVNNKKEAMAKARAIRTSPRKLNLVAASIRGMAVGKALSELTFSKRRVAQEVKKVLQSAIANAENNHNLDVDRLIVAESYVGKAMIMKRYHPMAKGRAGKIIKAFSNLTIVVREKEEKV